jgi:hypothetical protein
MIVARVQILAVALAAIASAQVTLPNAAPEVQTGPVLRTTTHAVVLDITVTDPHGNPVAGLKREDFTVLEDDAPQAIASFEGSTSLAGAEEHSPSRTVILSRLAIESGGKAFFRRNDVDRLVATSLAQSASFYTISYYPANGDYDGRFRKIQVQVKPRGLSARTRNGYYALPDNSSKSLAQITLEVKRALVTPLAYEAIPVSAGTLSDGEGAKRMLDLTVDGNALAWELQPNGDFKFHVMVGGAEYAADQFLKWQVFSFSGRLSALEMRNAKRKDVHFQVAEPKDLAASAFRLAVCDFKTGLVGAATMRK